MICNAAQSNPALPDAEPPRISDATPLERPRRSPVTDAVDGVVHLASAAALTAEAGSARGAEDAVDGAHRVSGWAARNLSRFARWLGVDSHVSLTRHEARRPSDRLWREAKTELGRAADDFAHVAESSANATDL